MCNGEYSYKWESILNNENFDFFELQFANCKRLESNDDIYIFDEVGTGKTISAGLMALHYIYNKYNWFDYKEVLGHKVYSKERSIVKGDKVDIDVLVITTDSVKNQFSKDWSEKLLIDTNFNKYKDEYKDKINQIFNGFNPFSKIVFSNNVCKNLEQYEYNSENNKIKIGLLIVDEAHLFIKNDDNNDEQMERYKALSKFRAEKTIFLTATPHRYAKSDMEKYVELSHKILGIDDRNSLDERKKVFCSCFAFSDDNKPICCKLDYNLCVTRYFKDTVRKLRSKSFKKNNAKRWIPEIWEYKDAALQGIDLVQMQNDYEAYCNNEKLHNKQLDKEIVLSLYNISKIRKEDIENKSLKNKFLIFMDRKEKGQTVFETHMKYINEYYQKSEYFYKFKNVGESDKSTKTLNDDNCLTYTIVNGDTDNSINDFCNGDVPDILIVISSTASQGVNLPGYSYIINFDVSASIANLEQRFGRIDRLNDTRFRNIHFVYMLGYRKKIIQILLKRFGNLINL